MNKQTRPDWNEFFMMTAILAATRSTCLHIKTGAVIVKDNRILATGYNGAPPGVKNSFELGWCRKEHHGKDFDTKGVGLCRGQHAEMNALLQVSRDRIKSGSLYTVYYPCSSCAKSIITSGIKEVFYIKNYKEGVNSTWEFFQEAGVDVNMMELNLDKNIKFLSNVVI